MTRKLSTLLTATAVLLAGCEKSADSFSLLSSGASFTQNSTFAQRPIDILWVVDNSGSMENSQANLAANFQSFINRFQTLNLDFRMGVITTDAYLAYHYNQNSRSQLRDRGVDTKGTLNCNDDTDLTTGIRIMDRNTPNLATVFVKNIKQGICGNGDERAFSSFRHALGNPLNNGFRRPGAFLSIIIVSDEDDFSHTDWQNGTNSYYFTENYNDSSMLSVASFTSYLDTLTNTTAGGVRNYSVSVISILDQACLNQLNDSAQKIGTRYKQLANATQGTQGSLCSNFGTTLDLISQQVVTLSSVFQLNREPIPASIYVTVNGVQVPQHATNGWTYNASNWTVQFHGASVPNGGADVQIFFEPATVQF